MNIRTSFRTAPIARVGIGVLLSVMTLSCVKLPTEPVLPQSDIQASIPIIDRMWTAADLITKDTSKIKQNAAGYYYADDRSFAPAKLDTMKVTPQSSVNQVGVGRLTVPGLPAQNSSVTASQLFPGPFPFNWPTGTFPSSSTTVPGVVMQDTADFDYLRISSGTMSVTVTNNLPMDITITQALVIKNNKLTAPVDTSTVASFTVGLVTAGQSKVVPASLAGILMRGDLKSGPISITTASKQGPFTINSTDGISFGFGTSSLVVDSSSAKIPQQNLVSINDSTISLDPTAVLQQALFSRGTFSLNVNNQTGLLVGARLKFSNFVRAVSPYDTLTIDTTIAGHTNFSFPVNLANFRVVNGSQGLAGGTALRFSVGIQTVNSQGAKLPVTYKDFVQASFLPQQQFVLKSLTGIMNPMAVNVNTGVALAGLGDASSRFSGSFSFDSIQFVLKVGLSSGFPVNHNLTLYAVNHNVRPATMDSMPIPPGTIYPGLSTPGIITLNNSVGLSTFLSKAILADTMYARGSLIVNPTSASGTIYDTTKVYPSMSMYIPLKLGLVGGQYADVIPIQGKFDSAFVANVQTGNMYMTITNHFPLGVQFKAAFMGLNSITRRVDTLLTLPLSPPAGQLYSIGGAHVNSAGSADQATTSRIQIGLSGQQMDLLSSSDSVYVKLLIGTSGATPSQAVRINATDYFRMQASANMVYTLKEKNK